MADVPITPKIRCDNCGATASKVEFATTGRGNVYKKPDDWGSVTIYRGSSHPDNIDMPDLCAACLRAVHEAVGNALTGRRGGDDVDVVDTAPEE